MSRLNALHIGAVVPGMHSNDLAGEVDAVRAYNESIRVCVEARDEGTKELLESILADEEEHVDWRRHQVPQAVRRSPAGHPVFPYPRPVRGRQPALQVHFSAIRRPGDGGP